LLSCDSQQVTTKKIIMALLGSSHFENFKKMNGVEVSCGRSGETLMGAIHAKEAIVRRLKRSSLKNKVLVIHLGDNDLCKEVGRQRLIDGKLEDMDQSRSNRVAESMILKMAAFVKYIRSEVDAISIVVVDLWNRTGSRSTVSFNRTRLLFNSKLNNVKADQIVRVSKKISKHHIREDGVHLNAKGLKIVQKELKAALSK
jgi:lysophospholipase L1-like esterase